MPDHRSDPPFTSSLFAELQPHERLLAMPSANDAPPVTNPGAFTFVSAWRERRFAAGCCRELLALHQATAARHAQVKGVALYRLVVAAHVGGDAAAADLLLRRARESYALWPEPRALTFRDVAHYLSVSGYWALHRGRRWVCSDIRRVVDTLIPHHL